MRIITAKYILPMRGEFEALSNHAIKFEKNIVSLAPISNLNADEKGILEDFGDAVIMPALSNTHTHLEYSANVASLAYGDFANWLKSVFAHRDALSAEDKKAAMKRGLGEMVRSGVGAIGEISSFGADIDLFEDCGARVVYFCEILGSNPAIFETAENGWRTRMAAAKERKSELFTPAVSVHSPYSTHPALAKVALKAARENDLLVSAHFMESEHEKEWLECGSGAFGEIFSRFSPNPKPLYAGGNEFLAQFAGIRTIFAHFVWGEEYLGALDQRLHFIAHCPRSNRLLSRRALNLETASQKVSVSIGTDGLSSNFSLNIWDELRAALFTHDKADLRELARDLLVMATANGARTLGLNSGVLEVGKAADLAIFAGLGEVEPEQLALQLILHTNEAKALFINGDKVQI